MMISELIQCYANDLDRSFRLCITTMDYERRNIRSGFDQRAEVIDRLEADLPLRRFTDGEHYNRCIEGRNGFIHNKSTITRQLRGLE